MASLARCLFYYSAAINDTAYLTLGKLILNYIINNAATDLGYSLSNKLMPIESSMLSILKL